MNEQEFRFEVRHVFIDRPEQVGRDDLVFNAPRPIPGRVVFNGQFIHGRFYAAFEYSDDDYRLCLKRCHELDAVLVMYHDKDAEIAGIREAVQEFYDAQRPGLVDVSEHGDNVVLRSWLQHIAVKEIML